jgi:hypothetical protein
VTISGKCAIAEAGHEGARQRRLFLPWHSLRANDDYSEGRQITRHRHYKLLFTQLIKQKRPSWDQVTSGSDPWPPARLAAAAADKYVIGRPCR